MKRPYGALYPVRSKVRIADRTELETFARDWKLHNPLTPEQISLAGQTTTVQSIGYYHGGDILYVLDGLPGVWHETCLAPPPPPDKSSMPRHRHQALEIVYSSDDAYRALLLRDNGGLIRISCEKWDLSEWERSGRGFWNPTGSGTTITDTIDSARKLARERLVELGAQ
jgi:predicted Rdx family selenoprotein